MRPKMNARKAFCRGFLHIDGVLLRKEREARTSPFPGRTHPIGSVSIVTLTRACWKRWRFCVVAAHEHERQLQAPPFPPEIMAHAVWLYVRFNLSLREIEEMLLKRGIDVSYETIRRWVAKFAPQIARNLRRRQAPPGDVWHLDKVVVTISDSGSGARLIKRGSFWRKFCNLSATSVPRTAICRFENESGACKGFALRAGCNGL